MAADEVSPRAYAPILSSGTVDLKDIQSIRHFLAYFWSLFS